MCNEKREREREGTLHIEIPQMKESDTKLNFQKCGSFANIKERCFWYAVNLGKTFLYVTYVIMRKIQISWHENRITIFVVLAILKSPNEHVRNECRTENKLE